MKQSAFLGAAALTVFWAGAALAQPANVTTTTVTNATGTIAQLNYGGDGEVQGFLIGTNILLEIPTEICGGVSTLGAVGNSVTYSGTAVTATSGFQSVRISSFTNNTTKATYTAPTNTPTAYGPTSGTVKQRNYSGDGSIDGFLFTAGGSTIFVSTGERASTTLSTLLTVGATVSVTGTTSPSMSACASTGEIQAVDASSLTIGTTTVVLSGGGPGGGRGGHGGGGPH